MEIPDHLIPSLAAIARNALKTNIDVLPDERVILLWFEIANNLTPVGPYQGHIQPTYVDTKPVARAPEPEVSLKDQWEKEGEEAFRAGTPREKLTGGPRVLAGRQAGWDRTKVKYVDETCKTDAAAQEAAVLVRPEVISNPAEDAEIDPAMMF